LTEIKLIDIFGMQQAIVNQKTALQAAIIPVYASLVGPQTVKNRTVVLGWV